MVKETSEDPDGEWSVSIELLKKSEVVDFGTVIYKLVTFLFTWTHLWNL